MHCLCKWGVGTYEDLIWNQIKCKILKYAADRSNRKTHNNIPFPKEYNWELRNKPSHYRTFINDKGNVTDHWGKKSDYPIN